MESDKLILDACCGSRMFWFDKHNPLVLFVDKRSETLTAKDKDRIRTIDVKPDVIAFYKCNHAKYRKYADEWLNNLTDAQIEGFERQRIGQIDKSKCV
nr:MAG: AdoMet dependent proline di-methyltransferase [Bacteriophage sp.]